VLINDKNMLKFLTINRPSILYTWKVGMFLQPDEFEISLFV